MGEIGQSFFSNRFSDPEPELSQGVLCLSGVLGISSCGGGLDPSFWGLVVGYGTSASCPVAILYTVTGIDSAVDLTNGAWVLTLATMRAGAVEVGVEGVGLVSTLTLYLHFAIMVPFLFITCLGSCGFPNHGVGAWLGWSWLGLLQLGSG